jgi:two-component system, OmpR family, alkaline phosphatase synthesis response regulator PhoP
MSGPGILVVDDEQHIVELLTMYLQKEGYAVDSANSGSAALEQFAKRQPDLVVLDLMLPDQDGFEVCRQIRAKGDTPIIMLTARDDDVDKIVGLELGADDYLTKPFNPRELLARAKAVLRRYRAEPAANEDVIRVGDVVIDRARREVTVAGRSVEMRAKEFDLLSAFARSPGVVMARDKLLNTVWGYDYYGDTRTIDVHVTWLRDKLEGSQAQIQTVWGVGYKLVVAETPLPKTGRRG